MRRADFTPEVNRLSTPVYPNATSPYHGIRNVTTSRCPNGDIFGFGCRRRTRAFPSGVAPANRSLNGFRTAGALRKNIGSGIKGGMPRDLVCIICVTDGI